MLDCYRLSAVRVARAASETTADFHLLDRKIMPGSTDLLKQADIFFQVPVDYLDKVAAICQEFSYQAGEIVFSEGSDSVDLYVIIQGEVDILVDPGLVGRQPEDPAQPVSIATLRRGQSFGEIALIDLGVRSATTRAAVDNTLLLAIPRDGLIKLCDRYPEMGYRLLRNLATDLATKLRSTDLLIRQELLFNLSVK